jgi:type IV pilus assembly protein PilE
MKPARAFARRPGAAAHRCRAFSLLELMIVCSLVAILLLLAIPGYRAYVMRGYRSTAIESLLAAAACQERIYAREFAYDTHRCREQDSAGKYELHFEPADTGGLKSFTVVATPAEPQREDPCGSLRLDHTGARGISGPAERLRQCWEGR